jgi:DNA-binding winged helix-turn-helix (wHTH) protein/Tfp pilus assembly protein PilF
MVMSKLLSRRYEFGPFRLDPRDRLLLRNEVIVALPPKVFETLLVFVQHSGHLLNKDELLSHIWPETIMEESNLTQAVYALRKALGQRLDGHHYIETIPRRGYRFVADVREIVQADASRLVRSLAVLPFRSLGTESSEYLRLGMANALITKLSNIQQITVRPTSAVLKYAGNEADPVTVGRELGVDSVLDGTIERSDDRIRVTVQLMRSGDGAAIWGETFDEQFTNIFGVEDSISEQVTRVLQLRLSGEEKRQLTKRYTENVRAYQAYLKGRYFWEKRTEEGMEKSIAFFEEAIDVDPSYALAYAGLADAHFLLGVYRARPPRETFPKAQAAAAKALELDSELAEAQCCLAYMKACYDWDWLGAEREFKRALELNPNYVTGHIWYSDYLSALGRFDEALAQVERALEMDQLSLISNLNLALPLYFARQYDRAIEQLHKTLELDQNYALGHWSLGRAYRQQGRYEEAIAELQKAVNLSGMSPLMVAALGRGYAVAGRSDEARKIINELEQLSGQRYISPYDIATIYLGLGERDQAFSWLDQAREERAGRLFFLKVDPYLDSLRPDPRFSALLHSVNLA